MAIEKMFFMNIAGPIREIDDCVLNYVIPNEVQLVSAETILETKEHVRHYYEPNPYEEVYKKASFLCKELGLEPQVVSTTDQCKLDLKKISDELSNLSSEYQNLSQLNKKALACIEHKKDVKQQIRLIKNLNVEVDQFFNLEYMKFRFGKMPKESYEKVLQFRDELEVVTELVSQDDEMVYIIYFMPRMVKEEIDTFFESLYFERIRLYDEIKGNPSEALEMLDRELADDEAMLTTVNEKVNAFIEANGEKIMAYYDVLGQMSQVFTARQYAMHSQESFFLSGWIPESKLDAFVESLKKSEIYSYEIEDEKVESLLTPPTKLKNTKFFKPFESLVTMYGTPSYHELDPTKFVGIIYLVMYGIMFGDVGQGLLIALLGYLFYKKTKAALGQVLVYLGFTSAIAGVFYGSFFGNETFLRKYLSFIPMINPIEQTMDVLIFAIVIGVIFLILSMALNIINAGRRKNIGKLLFDRNGLIGLMMYLCVLFVVLNIVLKWDLNIITPVVFIIVSLVILFLSHPLQHLLEGKKGFLPKDKVGFFVETIFEMIEFILGILSNTISFVRMGAFALNHVGFFIAFRMLSEMVSQAAGKPFGILIMIVGNAMVIVLEGLIVGIQGLRLLYYELFSRFYEGDGFVYQPFLKTKKSTQH